jgi:N-ethylmaleimide reductase
MAPLTRSRSEQPGDVPGNLMLEYYTQRASEGGLIISEATTISIAESGWFGAPGLYSNDQVADWKKITGVVHAKGGLMFSQLWHTGHLSKVSMTNGSPPVAPSVVQSYWLNSKPSISTSNGWAKPSPHRALDISEIPDLVEGYRKTAELAKAANFDGVELHAATAICPINSSKMPATTAPTPMATLRKPGALSSRSWCGVEIELLCGLVLPGRGTQCRIVTPAHCSVTWRKS